MAKDYRGSIGKAVQSATGMGRAMGYGVRPTASGFGAGLGGGRAPGVNLQNLGAGAAGAGGNWLSKLGLGAGIGAIGANWLPILVALGAAPWLIGEFMDLFGYNGPKTREQKHQKQISREQLIGQALLMKGERDESRAMREEGRSERRMEAKERSMGRADMRDMMEAMVRLNSLGQDRNIMEAITQAAMLHGLPSQLVPGSPDSSTQAVSGNVFAEAGLL
jgi:hypothetical protein